MIKNRNKDKITLLMKKYKFDRKRNTLDSLYMKNKNLSLYEKRMYLYPWEKINVITNGKMKKLARVIRWGQM